MLWRLLRTILMDMYINHAAIPDIVNRKSEASSAQALPHNELPPQAKPSCRHCHKYTHLSISEL